MPSDLFWFLAGGLSISAFYVLCYAVVDFGRTVRVMRYTAKKTVEAVAAIEPEPATQTTAAW